jgi:hypothetical protein
MKFLSPQGLSKTTLRCTMLMGPPKYFLKPLAAIAGCKARKGKHALKPSPLNVARPEHPSPKAR